MAEGWSGGEAVVREESTERFVVAEGTISTDGSFSLTLPVEGETLADALCTIDNNFSCPGPNSMSTIEITPGPFPTDTRWIYTEKIAPSPPTDPSPLPCEPDNPECAPPVTPVWSFSGER